MTPSQAFGIVATSVAFVAILVAIGAALAAVFDDNGEDDAEC